MSERQELVYEREIWLSKDVSSAVGDLCVRVRRGPPDIVGDWRVTIEEVKHNFTNREQAIEQAVAIVAKLRIPTEADDGEREATDGQDEN